MSAATHLPAMDRDMTSATDEQLLRVVGLIDALDRRGTVDTLLASVRTRLALLRPPRPLTLGRILVLPFEDLLVGPGEAWEGRCCFPRSGLGGLVEQITAGISAPRLAELRQQAAGRTMLDAESVRSIGAVIWPLAGTVVARVAANESLDPMRRAQLAAVAPLLSIATTLVPAIWQLPSRPITALARAQGELVIGSVRAALAAGNAAAQSVLEVLLARAGSPVLMLELLRQADLGIDARRREAMLAEAVRRRIADMGVIVARLTGSSEAAQRPSAAQMLRLVADLDALEHKWTISPEDRGALAGLRERAAAGIGSGIESAVEHQILGPLAILTRESLSDDDVEQLEDCARNARRLSIAGARLGLAPSPDAMVARYLPAVHEALRQPPVPSGQRRGRLEQLRVVEIMFGSDAAARLYDELRDRAAVA